MAFSIRNARVEEKARAYAAETGTTLTGALERALDKAMADARTADDRSGFVGFARDIGRRMRQLPVFDPRAPDDMLYGEGGAPR